MSKTLKAKLKNLMKNRFVWGIVGLYIIWIAYTIFQDDSGKVSWLPSDTLMPLVDVTIGGILFTSIVTLGAYRFGKIGGSIVGLLALPVLVWCERDRVTQADVLLEIAIVVFANIILILAVSEFVKEKKKLEKALAEVKTLSGLLPMCASCKKIRDDKGYWNAVEQYIGERTDTKFSHGICPDCMKKLYPEYADDFLGKKE